MSKKNRKPHLFVKPGIIRLVDQYYERSADGQMTRIGSQGQRVPRIRMSKKERLKLRKELRKIEEANSCEMEIKTESVSLASPKTDDQLRNETKKIEKNA
jgi:hypothetical protein